MSSQTHALSRRVLLLAPVGRTAAVMHQQLVAAGYDACVCDDLDTLLEALAAGAGCVLLLSEAIADPPRCTALYETLAAQPAWSALPVLVLARRRRDFLLWCRQRGRDLPRGLAVVERPVTPATLLAMVEAALQRRDTQCAQRDLLAALEERNQRLDHFGRTLAHDLRAPLQTLSLALDTLERLPPDATDLAASLLAKARKATRTIDRFSHDLLALAVAEAHDASTWRAVDLDALVHELAEEMRADDAREPIIHVATPLPTVHGHETLLRQLLQNLIGNGLKYNASSTPRVEISARACDARWELEVVDNGIGLSGDPEALFAPFARGNQLEASGTGLGLAICKRVVELHGGDIRACANADGGSTFTFTLPRTGPSQP